MQKRLLNHKDFQNQSKRGLRRLTDLRQLSHEFVNQLTVINFSCARIRASALAENAQPVVTELERIDKAVTTVCELLASLPGDDTSTSSSSHAAQPAKVYPLFKQRSKKR